ncbi:MAG: transporter substrate-binding domain-containing protein [Moraxella sp.]|nr:transporter substrate-binding domain-containing protein [Moraxella sp.]
MNFTRLKSALLVAMTALATTLALTACGQGDTTKNTGTNGERLIRIATEAAYPPFNDTSADGKIVGFDVDVVNAACAKMNAKCEIVAQDWDGLIPGLLTNKYDAIIAGMSITPDRLDKVDFSEPYFSNTLVWLTRTDGNFDPNAIKGKVLGGQRSTTGAALIQSTYDGKDGNRVQLYDTYNNAYLDMKAGRNDAVMAEKVSAKEWLKNAGEGIGIVGDELDNSDNLGIAVRKGDTLKAEFDKALNEMKASGELANIEAAHFAQ